MFQKLFAACVLCLCVPMVASAQDKPTDVSKQPFLTVLGSDGAGGVKLFRGRYLGIAETADEAPVEGLCAVKVLVRESSGERLVTGWCFGCPKAPVDITKRPFVSILVTDPASGDVRTVRGRYLGSAEDLAEEPPVEGMVTATVLVQEPDPTAAAKKIDVLYKGWAFPPLKITQSK